METTIGVSRSSGTVTEGDLAPLPHQEAQDHSLETKFDVSLSRNSEHPDGHDRVEQKSHSKFVHSGQPQVFDNKQQAHLVVIMLFITSL